MLPALAAFFATLAFASADSYESGLRSLQLLSQGKGNEVSRSFYFTRSASSSEALWGEPVEGDEAQTGIAVEEGFAKIEQAKAARATEFRICNFHTHRKGAVLRLQRERKEWPKRENRSFPPSGADLQLSLVGDDSWNEWQLAGESALGVVDSVGVWLFRELSQDETNLKRKALTQKFSFTKEEWASTLQSKIDASENGRYEFMKLANSRDIKARDISSLPAYRKLVLQYAAIESVELVFLSLEDAVKAGPCRGF